MLVKTITITEQAYELLSVNKAPNESFSQIIQKHFKKESLLSLAGILTRAEAEELRKNIAKGRKALRKRIGRTAKRLQRICVS